MTFILLCICNQLLHTDITRVESYIDTNLSNLLIPANYIKTYRMVILDTKFNEF